MNWWRRLRGEAELERQLDRELRYHFERLATDYMRRGLDEAEARRQARLEFGGLEQVKEKCRDARGTRWAEALAQDLRYAFRQLGSNRAFTAVALLAMALGIGANTAVFTVANGVLLRPLPFAHPERLYLVSRLPKVNPFHWQPSLTDRDYSEYRNRQQSFERIATFQGQAVTLTGSGEPVRLQAATATADFLRILGAGAAMGRTFLEEDERPDRAVAILSHQLWSSRFHADPNILGKSLTLDGVPRTIVGVMPQGFQFPYNAELWTPLAVRLDKGISFIRPVVGRLKPGISPRQAHDELRAIGSHLPKPPGEDDQGEFVSQVLPLQELFVADARKPLLFFAAAVGFVLLIACANVANLLLIRAASRRQEIAVRAALGAGRRRLIRQFLTESTMISLCGGALGLLIATWAVPGLVALAPAGSIPRVDEIRIDRWVLAFTAGLSILTGLAFGLIPAVYATRRDLRDSLNSGGRALTAGRKRLRGALVVAEIALSLVLLTGAGLMLKSFLHMRSVHLGFRPENVISIGVDLPESVYTTAAQVQSFHQRVTGALASLPGVIASGAVNWLPLGGMSTWGDFHLDGGRELPHAYQVEKPCVSPGYFGALGIRLIAGRDFADRDNANAPGVVIVSQSVAKTAWGGEDPIGKRLTSEDHPKPEDWLTVVGVVEDVRQSAVTKAPMGAIYQPYLQVARRGWLTHMNFLIRTNTAPEAAARELRNAVHHADPDLPAQNVAAMTDFVMRQTATPLFETRLLGGFSSIALLLAALGIYGVLAYAVAERRHEIGIRMALGAARADVVGMVLRRTALLAAAGIALGGAAAVLLARFAATLAVNETPALYEVSATDPAIYLAVAGLLGGVALAAGALPAARASRVDPASALRCE